MILAWCPALTIIVGLVFLAIVAHATHLWWIER